MAILAYGWGLLGQALLLAACCLPLPLLSTVEEVQEVMGADGLLAILAKKPC